MKVSDIGNLSALHERRERASRMTARQQEGARRAAWPMAWQAAVATLAIMSTSCGTLAAPTAPASGRFTEVFASQLGVRGTATRSFTVDEPGIMNVN